MFGEKSESSKLFFAHGGGLVNICCLKARTHMLSNPSFSQRIRPPATAAPPIPYLTLFSVDLMDVLKLGQSRTARASRLNLP